MKRTVIPLDSLAVVPAASAEAASAVWSEELAQVIAKHLALSRELRVVPPALVGAWAASGEYTPEEIARHFNARCVIRCAVNVVRDHLDVNVEIIDALAESVMCDSTYLVSAGEARYMQNEIVRWLARSCFAGIPSPAFNGFDPESYTRTMKAKILRREGRIAEAMALALGLPVLAEIAVDAPSVFLDAVPSIEGADDLTAARILCRFHRDWATANEAFARAILRGNADPSAHAHYGLFLAAMRRFDDAERELRAANELCDAVMAQRALIERGFAYCGRGGRAAIADDDRYADAIGHAIRDEFDAALGALDDAARTYSPYVMFAAVDPAFVPLRAHERFTELLRELRLL